MIRDFLFGAIKDFFSCEKGYCFPCICLYHDYKRGCICFPFCMACTDGDSVDDDLLDENSNSYGDHDSCCCVLGIGGCISVEKKSYTSEDYYGGDKRLADYIEKNGAEFQTISTRYDCCIFSERVKSEDTLTVSKINMYRAQRWRENADKTLNENLLPDLTNIVDTYLYSPDNPYFREMK